MYCYINKKYYLCSLKYLIVLHLWQQQLSENQPLSDLGPTCWRDWEATQSEKTVHSTTMWRVCCSSTFIVSRKYKRFPECHINGDFLLIWIDKNTNVIELARQAATVSYSSNQIISQPSICQAQQVVLGADEGYQRFQQCS